MIEVLRPGALTLVQDLGRTGQQRCGVPVSGAIDLWSHRLGNALVGNPDEAAALEITLTGPTLRFTTDALLALTGAELGAIVTGPGGSEPLPRGRPVAIRAGATVECGPCRGGVRSTLAVRGGIDVPAVLGSRSTWMMGRLGGVDGGPLLRGTTLAVGVLDRSAAGRRAWPNRHWHRSSSRALWLPAVPLVVPVPALDPVPVLRVIEGGEWAAFTPASQAAFLSAGYRISRNSDRMGYRLEGTMLERVRPIEMISEAVAFGTVQVPPDGLPIVLMADRQTVGGYPKLAQVISADLPLLAQAGPGQAIRFRMITLADAQRILLARERELRHVREIVGLALANERVTPWENE